MISNIRAKCKIVDGEKYLWLEENINGLDYWTHKTNVNDEYIASAITCMIEALCRRKKQIESTIDPKL